MAVQNAREALIVYLLTVSDLTDMVSTRIYGGELPEADVGSMPRACIVIRYAGGLEAFRSHRLHYPRLDCFCYGDGYYQAGQVDAELAGALFDLVNQDINDTFLRSVAYSGGPRELKEPEHGWPYVARSVTLLADERSTA